jgi:hypothetical protein
LIWFLDFGISASSHNFYSENALDKFTDPRPPPSSTLPFCSLNLCRWFGLDGGAVQVEALKRDKAGLAARVLELQDENERLRKQIVSAA